MNCLELRVGKRRMDERRQAVVMEKSFHRVQACRHFVGRRRHIGGIVQTASRRPDPVLTSPELSRSCHVPPNAPHEPFMDLPDETKRQRQRFEAVQPVLQCGHMVGNFVQIRWVRSARRTGLGREQLFESRPGAFDSA